MSIPWEGLMSRLISYNNRGIGLIEVVIAIFLVTVGVLAILSMQPSAWKLVGKSDYLGRAAGMLHKELETRQACVMDSCIPLAACQNPATHQVFVSGNAAEVPNAGDAPYTLQTQITDVTPGPNSVKMYNIQVTVTWKDPMVPGLRNLVESAIVTLQQPFSFNSAQPNPQLCSDVR